MTDAVERPFSVLFIPPSRIGDAILTTGILRHLLGTYPNAAFTIVASPATASLFGDLPGLEAVIPFAKSRRKTHWPALWWSVKGRRWDMVVDMRGSALAYLLRARTRVVYRPDPPDSPPRHKVLAAAALFGREDAPPAPFVVASPATDASAGALLAGEGALLAVAPGASWPGKMWPAERFAELVHRLAASDGPLPSSRVVLVGGPDDRAASLPLRHCLAPDCVVDLLGLDLVTTFACLKRVRLFVGNDSGMMHLAAAAGVPTLGLFGPTPDQLYRPWGDRSAFVRGPRDYSAYGEGQPGFDPEVCHLMDLEVTTVLEAAVALLSRTSAARGSYQTAQFSPRPLNPPSLRGAPRRSNPG